MADSKGKGRLMIGTCYFALGPKDIWPINF